MIHVKLVHGLVLFRGLVETQAAMQVSKIILKYALPKPKFKVSHIPRFSKHRDQTSPTKAT